MKRLILIITVVLSMAANAGAMSYEQARREALFLTDKMAYELNLTESQYEAAYEINLDYLMGIDDRDHDRIYGTYWTRRNLDLSYILLDWQWAAFRAATYFYRPIYWRTGHWHFAVYSRYPNRTFYYFSRPAVYVTYRGGHCWHRNGNKSYYYKHRNHYRKYNKSHGLKDRWERGEFKGNRHNAIGHSSAAGVGKGSLTGSKANGSFSGNRNRPTAVDKIKHGSGSSSLGSFGGSRPSGSNRGTVGTFKKKDPNGIGKGGSQRPSLMNDMKGNTMKRKDSGNRSSGTFRNNGMKDMKSNTQSPLIKRLSNTSSTTRPASGIRTTSSQTRSGSFGGARGASSGVRKSFSGSTRSSAGSVRPQSRGGFGSNR